jgi:hypothetical protein
MAEYQEASALNDDPIPEAFLGYLVPAREFGKAATTSK